MKRVFIFILFLSIVFFSAKSLSGESVPVGFVVSTWNIGHYANGKKNHSMITSHLYQSKLKSFRDLLEDSVAADIMCINEYSHVFGIDHSQKQKRSKRVLFNHYKIKKEGRLMGFSCNAIFSNLRVKNVQEHLFKSSEPFIKETPRAANYYYLSGDLYVNGVLVKLICAHTTSGAAKICQAQIAELIKDFEKYDRVIMCGDWNTTNFSKFRKAGYVMANDGSVITFPSKSYALDNIIVKGLYIDGVRVLKTNLSDHYPLVCRIIVQ